MNPSVVNLFPPHYKELRKHFGAENVRRAVFAYGDAIYNPHKIDVTQDMIAHEREHCLAQLRIGISPWWEQYISNSDFRLTEELLGHREEYAYLRDVRQLQGVSLRRALEHIARRLSGPLYAHMISFDDAVGEIERRG